VAARTIATHALSIFGDHSDVMAARPTGWAMLASSTVQEAHDLAAVAHAATLACRVPFLHFFDGFRTSHEVAKIRMLADDDLRALVDGADVRAHRDRGLSPDRPQLRGSAQNPDVFFQARAAVNPFYAAVPEVVQAKLDELAARTGRRYRLVDYEGAPDADRVLVLMGAGAGAGAASEAVAAMTAAGEKVGLATFRLYRPFPAEALAAALPETVRRVAVLDRTKEPGAAGEPLYQDVVTALAERAAGGGAPMPLVVGGATGWRPRSSPLRWPRRCWTRSPPSGPATTSRSGSPTTSPTPVCRSTPRSPPRTLTACGRSSSGWGPTAPWAPTRPR